MQVSKNFTLEELTRSSIATVMNIPNLPNENETVNLIRLATHVLQPLRDRWKKPIIITSGFRCHALNKMVGGAINSQHLVGEAADVTSDDNRLLFNMALDMIKEGVLKVGQLIDEKNYRWLHISLPTDRHLNHILHIP